MSSVVHIGSDGKREFVRFRRSHRLEHLVNIVSFTTLCATGLPQHFALHPWASSLIAWMGGIDATRRIHRVAAVILMAQLVLHVLLRMGGLLRGHDLTAILPRPRDAHDALRMGLWLVGLQKDKPRFGRYDFRQKFEYWAMMWGTIVMIATGLAMWFPVLVTRWLPGFLIPVARVVHGGEALLAVLTIATWHMYCAVISLEVFPLDTSIFTGRISERRMLHEHPLEHERVLREHGLLPRLPTMPSIHDGSPAPIPEDGSDAAGAAYREIALSLVSIGGNAEGAVPAHDEARWTMRPDEGSEAVPMDLRRKSENPSTLESSLEVSVHVNIDDFEGIDDDETLTFRRVASGIRRSMRSIADTDPCDMRGMMESNSA